MSRNIWFRRSKISRSLVAWSIVAGPVFGIAAYGFRALTRAATAQTPGGWHKVPSCLAVFLAIGLLATLFPQLPGNGKGPSQLGFGGDLGGKLALGLLALKVVAIAASLRVGAAGGVLTPSLTVGALLAVVLGSLWNLVLPSVPTAAFAVVGAAAFLASSMNMPLTAIALIIEFTRVGHDLWVPIFLAVAASVVSLQACARRDAERSGRSPVKIRLAGRQVRLPGELGKQSLDDRSGESSGRFAAAIEHNPRVAARGRL